MTFYPPIKLTLWNGFELVIPLLLMRFGIPAFIKHGSGEALDHFPPCMGIEKTALRVYFVTNTYLIFSPLLAKIHVSSPLAQGGIILYLAGLTILMIALLEFCKAERGTIILTGIYRFSRNPIYIGYFLIFIGISLLIQSWFYLGVSLVYQIAVHFLILSEERWCTENFADAYKNYRANVNRYIFKKG